MAGRIAEATVGSRRVGGPGIDRIAGGSRQPGPACLVGIEDEESVPPDQATS